MPGPLDLGLEATQNTDSALNPSLSAAPRPHAAGAAGALPARAGGMSPARQPVGAPGIGSGGRCRDAAQGAELEGSRCPDSRVTAGTSALAGGRNSPQRQKMAVKLPSFPALQVCARWVPADPWSCAPAMGGVPWGEAKGFGKHK